MSTLVVVPCSKDKSKTPCRAESMYLGQLHILAMQAARSLVDDVEQLRILSGKHGLLKLSDELWPYEQRIDEPGHVSTAALTAQLLAVDREDGERLLIVSLCPKSYTAALRLAAERLVDVELTAPLAGSSGIGVIRQRLANIIRHGWAAVPVTRR